MEFTIEKIEENALKERCVRDLLGDRCSDELIKELGASCFWALLSENKFYGYITLVDHDENFKKVSHFMLPEQLFESDVAIALYIEAEKYCVKNNYASMIIKIPANVRGLTERLRKFFKKRLGFKSQFKVYGSEGEFVMLMKHDIKNWYTEKDGELIPKTQQNNQSS